MVFIFNFVIGRIKGKGEKEDFRKVLNISGISIYFVKGNRVVKYLKI